MLHSTITSKVQTTNPETIPKALLLKPGDRREYAVEADHAAIREHPGTLSLKGVLASSKGKGLFFSEISAAEITRARERPR